MKQRLVGAAVLVALAVIFLPMLVKGPAPDSGVSDVPLDVPAEPKDADGGMVSHDLPLVAPAGAPEGGATGMPAAVAAPAATPAQAGAFPANAAGDFAVSFGSYATAADADKVIAALKAAELSAYRDTVTLNGRPAERVRIGPFADRAVAESARLRAAQVNPAAGAKVVALDADSTAPTAAPVPSTAAAAAPAAPVKAEPLPPPVAKPVAAPATVKPAAVADAKPATATATPATPTAPKPEPATRPVDTGKTGFAVQVGAFADAAAATALRDKLRGAGFNAFTDSVNTEAGTRTRVRVGPAMNRAEADALKAQVKARAGVDGIVRPHP